MPHDLKNWSFDDVVEFLLRHYFYHEATRNSGSHRMYIGLVDGKERLVPVWFHAGNSFSPREMRDFIILKSGIPKEIWIEWAHAGNKQARKNIKYHGATEPKK